MKGNKETMTQEEVLARLVEGNRRFAAGRAEAPRRDGGRRMETAGGQAPDAVVLCCSDSRVVPELIFDQGIGDLFTVRVAGNVIDDVVLGSIEYAATHLSVGLVIVLGHTCCGAVDATLSGRNEEGHTGSVTECIRKVAESCGSHDHDGVARASALSAGAELRRSLPVLGPLVEEGRLAVISAMYDIVTGEVEMLETPPGG